MSIQILEIVLEPAISERYSHAFRPSEWVSDSLLVENKMMREIGIKIISTGKKLSPHFQGPMSYFSYLYKNKIKSIQYSAFINAVSTEQWRCKYFRC